MKGRSYDVIGIGDCGTQGVCSNDIRKLCILCKNKNVLEVGIKKSVYIETTRLHKITQD